MNKQDLILKGLKIIIEGDYFPNGEKWLKEYESVYNKESNEPCCEMPEEKDVLVSKEVKKDE